MHRFGACCLTAVRETVGRYGYLASGVGDWLALGEGALDATHIVWHHDASAQGFSPGMAAYIQRQVRDGKPGANVWVGLDGGWRFLAVGVTYHAGKVLPGKPGNSRSVGIETDHTTGEVIGLDLLLSLRAGTAALLEHWERDAEAVEFHKTICAPVGRKTDPDGLDLAVERAAVAELIGDDMTPEQAKQLAETRLVVAGLQQDMAKILNALAGYATKDGKRDPKDLSLIGEIAEKHGIDR